MSRASKYLRKKKAEGGLLDPEALKNLAAANPPKPGTGVAGPAELSSSDAMSALKDSMLAQQNKVGGQIPEQTPAGQQRVRTDGTTQSLMADFQARQNQPAPSAQRPDDGMPPWMTNKQKAALKQANAENQATMESPEYQEALQKLEASKGQDSEAQALLEKLGDEMTAIQNAAAPQPRFTKESLTGVQGQQLQGNTPQRMAASAVSPATRPPKPNSADYPLGPRDPAYTAAMNAHNTWTPPEDNTPAAETTTAPVNTSTPTTFSNGDPRPESNAYPSYDAFRTALAAWEAVQGPEGPDYGGPGTTDEEEDTTPTTTPVDDDEGTSKIISEEPVKPSEERYEKPVTPRDCSNVSGRNESACLAGRQLEKEAMSAWNKVDESWNKYDSDLEAFENFDPDDYTDNNNNTGNTGGNNNNNNTGDNVNENDQVEGNVGSSDYTVIDKADSGAPTGITQDRPDVTAPTVGVEKITAERPLRANFTDLVDAEGNVTKTQDERYQQALNSYDNQATGRGTITTSGKIETVGKAKEIERTEDDKVSPTEIVAAQMGTKPIAPKSIDFDLTVPGGRKAFKVANEKYEGDLARYEKGIEVDAPTASTAASMTASTISQELPTKPMRTEFPEGEEGTAKYAAARESFNVQVEELRGEERPRFHQFDGNREAYEQALKDFQEAPLPVTEEVKAAQGSIEEGSKAIATQADGAVSEGAKATAAARNIVTENAALAGEAEFKEDTASTVKAVTGKVATVEEWKDSTAAEAREGELPVKPLPTDFEGGATSEAYKQAESEYNAELEDIRGMPFPKRENYDSTAEFNAAKKKFQEEPYMAREALQREAIVGEPATGEAAEIMSMYDYNQSQKRAIQGADAKKAAVKKLKAAGLSDETIAQRLADEPNLVADEMEDMPEDVRTTLSGLPKEALIDVQMESLMSGMEDGEVPAWARPALAKVEANLAKRGMTASSVGRDALFNAIIQSAIPMAQANASAIQGATAQDKQIAADFLAKNAGFQQQMNLANLSNDQQMRLANLTAQNQASSENLNAKQQIELTNLNAKLQTNLLQGKIAAEMGVAQLNVDQQTAVVNAQTSAGIDMAKYNAAQQVELTNSKFMQTMVATKFNADQQAAMQNATAMASMDMANLDKNTKLAVTNAQSFLQMDMANLSNEQQASVLTAQQRQQALLSNQSAENAAAQFNAANQQQADQFMQNLGVQVEQYNASANSARDQFNTTEKNRIAALNAGNELQAQQFEAQLDTDIAKFNETQDFQRDQWNAANAQAVEQSNVQWRRQANLADTAAQNAANQQNAQISYNLTSQELTQVWQQMRDEAAYIRQSFENEEQRKAQLLATAIGNEKLAESFDKGTNQAKWLDEISSAIS